MKPTHLIWVLALAGVALACNTGPPITNEKPIDPGTGGTTGTGGAGGLGEGACTTEENLAVYEDLVYIDCDEMEHTGAAASSAIGSDCIFGTTDPSRCPAGSVPPIPGCGPEAFAVVGCGSGCDQATIDALATCVAMCTQDATGLSDECMACTGTTVACGAAFCTSECVGGTDLPPCVECRCENNCDSEFVKCSGLPSSIDCG
jgi:hypothetical protein